MRFMALVGLTLALFAVAKGAADVDVLGISDSGLALRAQLLAEGYKEGMSLKCFYSCILKLPRVL